MMDGDLRPPGRRAFLFLQGLATDFFVKLGDALLARGHAVHRINFNGGDRRFWPRPGAVDYCGNLAAWPDFLRPFLVQRSVTDLVLFGDCRPLHRAAIALARPLGIAVHVFEEAYLRPGYITLERDGVNGHSRLPRDPDWFRRVGPALPPLPPRDPVPASFPRRAADDLRYNWHAWHGRRRFRHWDTHRAWPARQEYLGWAWRGAKRPVNAAASRRALQRLENGAPCFLFPLQLEGDSQLRFHSPFRSMRDAVATVINSFARAAPADSWLVVKGHPLDNGLLQWKHIVAELARGSGVAERVLHVPEAPFTPLLERSRALVTVNSTAGLQALTTGTPVATLGDAVYGVRGLTWNAGTDGLDAFWQAATPPDAELLECFLRVLGTRCLLSGGFFSDAGIALGVAAAVQRLEDGDTVLTQLLASAA